MVYRLRRTTDQCQPSNFSNRDETHLCIVKISNYVWRENRIFCKGQLLTN